MRGVVGLYRRGRQSPREVKNRFDSGTVLERRTIESDSLVREIEAASWVRYPSTAGHVEPCRNLGGPSSKAKHY